VVTGAQSARDYPTGDGGEGKKQGGREGTEKGREGIVGKGERRKKQRREG